MTQLAENHKLPNLILSYRNLLKLKNTYTDKLEHKSATSLIDCIHHIIRL